MHPGYYTRRQITDIISVDSIITVYHLDMRKKTRVGGDVHDFPEICFVEEGSLTPYIDGKPVSLNKGQMVIYAPNAYHGPKTPFYYDYINAVLGIISFASNSESLNGLYNRAITLNAKQLEMLSEIITLGISHFKFTKSGGHINNLPHTEHTDRDLQKMKNMLEIFLLDIYSGERQKSYAFSGSNKEKLKFEQMKELTDYLQLRLNQTLTLEEISHDLGFSVSKLRRLVFEQRGCGPIAYFIELKIEEAKTLIKTTSLNITEISEQLGFSSLHYFSKQFKSKTGKSPTAYAKTIDKR
ncbi:MAG: helix-turn-helix domain-containing protein [Clostridia bacterium]|nr:helix-turn-helix domain-containing protein [Clostridia bacterium]